MKLTTTNLRLSSPRAWWNLPVPMAATICIFCLLAIAGLVGKIHTAPAVAVQPTPALVIVYATPAPVPSAAPVQVAAQLPNALHHAAVAYGAPDLATAIGAIEQGRTYTILARYGAEWLQADVTDSGVVWLRASDVLDLPADLADLKPAPAPVVIERPIYIASQPAPAAVATPEEQYQITSAPPTMAPQAQAILDRGAWASTAATAQAGR
jgi:hypothetical protein